MNFPKKKEKKELTQIDKAKRNAWLIKNGARKGMCMNVVASKMTLEEIFADDKKYQCRVAELFLMDDEITDSLMAMEKN